MLRGRYHSLAQSIRNSRTWRTAARLARALLPLPRRHRRFGQPSPRAYNRWIAAFEQRDTAEIAASINHLRRTPLLSIVVSDAPDSATLRSVAAQTYSNWELLLQNGVLPTNDARIRIVGDPVTAAAGDYTIVVQAGDELAVDALYYVAAALDEHADADVLYSDEDRLDSAGRRVAPFFKPDWSPDLMLSSHYVGDLFAIRTDLLKTAPAECRLDLVSRAHTVVHIPRVLYHRRSPAPQRVARVSYPVAPGARVSILVPSSGKLGVLERNLEALFGESEFQDFEVVVIDNSKASAIECYVTELSRGGRSVRYFDQRRQPFNYSRLNNLAANTCRTDLLLFLNDDTRLLAPASLTAMVELAARPEVGAVGAKLLYPDGRIQHAGIVMGMYGVCGHAFKGALAQEHHYFGFPDVVRNVSAVTGACLMVRADVFARTGGFDEDAFPIAYNDVDLCLRIGRLGYRILYTPHAVFTHYEAYSKTSEQLTPHPSETQTLVERWAHIVAHDPFYSPNLTRTAEDYSLRSKPGGAVSGAISGAATAALPE